VNEKRTKHKTLMVGTVNGRGYQAMPGMRVANVKKGRCIVGTNPAGSS
jgi:hypothetical protein